jgi:tetratricopeptide (TPR) repeat protein
MGELEAARDSAETAIKVQSDLGIPFYLSIANVVLSMVCLDTGELDYAQRYAYKALEAAQSSNEGQFEVYAKMQLGRVLAKGDDSPHENAIDHIMRGIKRADELKLRVLCSHGYYYLGEAYIDTGQKEKALEALKKAEAEFREMGMDYWLRRTEEVLNRLES